MSDGPIEVSAADRTDLAADARRILAANRYLTLSTVDPDGRPWVTPVYFAPDGLRRLLWVSGPDARHSRNLAERPDVAIVVFDSTVAIGQGEAVYLSAAAAEVADADLAAATEAFAARDGLEGYGPADLRAPSPFRLYQAVPTQWSVLVRGGDPRNPHGIDRRAKVEL